MLWLSCPWLKRPACDLQRDFSTTSYRSSVEQIADRILMLLGKPHTLKTYVPDRPGHDRRYLLNSSKIRCELGWAPEVAFNEGMRQTVAWYLENQAWWRPLQARLAVAEGEW